MSENPSQDSTFVSYKSNSAPPVVVDLEESVTASSIKSTITPHISVIQTAITIPPDGGWGWLVVAAAFLCNFVADGSIYTYGIFLDEIGKTFNVSDTTVSIGNSLIAGFYYSTGPITCALVNRWGFQITGFTGGIIAAAAFFLSAIQTSIAGFLAIYGIMGGFGFGLVYVPSIVVIGFYFERWRALATAIAVTGSATGIIAFPYIINGFLEKYTWQTKFKIVSGGCLITSFLALIYRPLKPVRVAYTDKKTIEQFENQSEFESKTSFRSTKHKGPLAKIFNRLHNVAYPTASQLHHDSTIVINISNTPSSTSTFITVNGLEQSNTSFVKPTVSKLDKLSTVYEDETRTGCWQNCKQCNCCKKWCHWVGHNKPMYRDDIFYTGSVYHLEQFSKSATSTPIRNKQAQSQDKMPPNMEYHLSVTRVAVHEGGKEKVHCKCCPESVVRTLVTMLNFSLLKSPKFCILCLSGALTLLGMFVPFIFFEKKLEESGIKDSKTVSSYIFTCIGVANALGRVLSGLITTIPRAKPLIVSYVSIFICGLSVVAATFCKDFVGHAICASIFGLTIASLASLRAPIVVEMLGLESLTNAFGLILLFEGFAAFSGMPIAGEIVHWTGSYNAVFNFAGAFIILSAIMLMPLKQISNWEDKRRRDNVRRD